MKYVHVGTKRELEETLLVPGVEEMDCIVEIESSIDANAMVHRLFGLSLRLYMSILSCVFC